MPDRNVEDLQQLKEVQKRQNRFSRNPARLDVPGTPELERVQRFLLNYDVQLLHGPPVVEYAKDELVVLCLLRNGRPYIKAFIEHYFTLGAKHIVFLDNGSTDGTVEALSNYKGVSVLRTELPFRRYQLLMRRYLTDRFGKGRWSLLVDIDELFDYPLSDVVSLEELLSYLNRHSYTAVVAHMLDMFPGEPISRQSVMADVSLKESHRFYDLSDTFSYNYQDAGEYRNAASNAEIEILQGGVQHRLFKIQPLLTKHPLVFFDEEVTPVDWSEHWAGGARVADFTGVLFHYKLLGLHDLVQQEIKERRYVNRHGKYEKYFKVLEKSPSLLARNETSRELESVNDLIGTQYNSISEEYIKFAARKEREKNGTSSDGDSIYPQLLLKPLLRARAEARAVRQRAQGLERERRELRRQVRELESQLHKQENRRQQQVQRAVQRAENAVQRAENLERRLRAVQSSKTWKLMSVLGHVKRKGTGAWAYLTGRSRAT
ncbi:MAG: glycosyltransferase family 2 protein [Rubrobacteraceae bacterium]